MSVWHRRPAPYCGCARLPGPGARGKLGGASAGAGDGEGFDFYFMIFQEKKKGNIKV